MTNVTEKYRAAAAPAPKEYKRWHLRGAGLESLSEEAVSLPAIADDQLVVRHDACGICFSDIKIINLGPQHPRLVGRDMVSEPVVMGHEVALTVVKVGDKLADKFKVGERFIVQADVYYKGANLAYGYVLDGGMSQYGIVGDEVLRGDEGCYLLPLRDDTGYVEAALVEPWACVVAAYQYTNYRSGAKSGGATLVYYATQVLGRLTPKEIASAGGPPATFIEIDSLDQLDAAKGKNALAGFDDIIVIGTPAANQIETLAATLGKNGTMNLALDGPLEGSATLDIGRIHYDQQLYIGGRVKAASEAKAAYTQNERSDLKAGGVAWFIGAGGPMGQMHIQRAVMHDNPPKTLVVTDVSDERLGRIHERFGAKAAERGIRIVSINPDTLGRAGYDSALREQGPFDDIVCLVPVAPIVSQTAPYLGKNGVYNIFAGVARGVTAPLEIGTIVEAGQRFIGTSGSSIDDLRRTLQLVEDNKLSTNASLAAIGGMGAFRDGLGAVKAGKFPGKTVIFPHIKDLPLLSLADLKEQLPKVFAKLEDGKFWTQAAEDELLAEKLT